MKQSAPSEATAVNPIIRVSSAQRLRIPYLKSLLGLEVISHENLPHSVFKVVGGKGSGADRGSRPFIETDK